MADPGDLVFYKALYDGDLVGVRAAVDSGADPLTTHFHIQTDEMCLCSLAFENLGLEFVEEYTPFDGNYGSSADECSGDNVNRKAADALPPTRIYQPPLLEWLESGQCGHVMARSANGVHQSVADEEGGEYESEDDLASDLDLEIYGVRISPQRAPADEDLDYEETRALLEHSRSRRIKQYEVPTPPDPTPALGQPPTPKHEPHTIRDVTDSMNNLLIQNEASEGGTPDGETPKLQEAGGDSDNDVFTTEDNEDDADDDDVDEAVFAEVLKAQASNDAGPAVDCKQPRAFPCFRELESLGSEDGVGSDFFMTELKEASVSPAHVAAARGHGDMIEYLVTSTSCDLNAGTLGSEDTALHIAARWGHTDTVRLLLRLGADPHRLNAMGYSALHLAIESNDEACIGVMLESLSDLPSLDVQTKQVLLVHALAQDAVLLTVSLLDKLAIRVNEQLFDCGSSILHKAAAVGSPACLRRILEQGAEPNAVNQEGETPLHVAAANGHVMCVMYLLEGGAVPIPANNWMIGDSQTPTMLAAYNNYPDVVDLLLPHDDVTVCSEYGDTALHYAAYRGCVEMVEALVTAGAAVNRRNCYGATPLWNGVCHADVLRLLIKAGADVNVHSSGHNLDHIDGVVYDSPRSPIEVTVEEGFFDSAEILLRAGCKVPPKIQHLLGEAYERFEVHKDVMPVLTALISQPPSLKQACRARIVHSIDYQLAKIETLHIDDDVRRYLRYHVL